MDTAYTSSQLRKFTEVLESQGTTPPYFQRGLASGVMSLIFHPHADLSDLEAICAALRLPKCLLLARRPWARIVTGVYISGEAYRKAILSNPDNRIDEQALGMLQRISITAQRDRVGFAMLSAENLGLGLGGASPGVTIANVLIRGILSGFDPCLPEDGPALMLARKQIPDFSHACIAMNPVRNDNHDDMIFILQHQNDVLWLLGSEAASNVIHSSNSQWIFRVPSKKTVK